MLRLVLSSSLKAAFMFTPKFFSSFKTEKQKRSKREAKEEQKKDALDRRHQIVNRLLSATSILTRYHGCHLKGFRSRPIAVGPEREPESYRQTLGRALKPLSLFSWMI